MPRAHDLGSQYPSDAADSAPADPRGSREEFDYAIRVARPQLIPETQALITEELADVASDLVYYVARVRSDSQYGRIASYRVDIFGQTLESIDEGATEFNVLLSQQVREFTFYPGEICGVIVLQGQRYITKLHQIPITIETGQLWVRGYLEGSTSSNQDRQVRYGIANSPLFYFDYALMLTYFTAFEFQSLAIAFNIPQENDIILAFDMHTLFIARPNNVDTAIVPTVVNTNMINLGSDNEGLLIFRPDPFSTTPNWAFINLEESWWGSLTEFALDQYHYQAGWKYVAPD